MRKLTLLTVIVYLHFSVYSCFISGVENDVVKLNQGDKAPFAGFLYTEDYNKEIVTDLQKYDLIMELGIITFFDVRITKLDDIFDKLEAKNLELSKEITSYIEERIKREEKYRYTITGLGVGMGVGWGLFLTVVGILVAVVSINQYYSNK